MLFCTAVVDINECCLIQFIHKFLHLKLCIGRDFHSHHAAIESDAVCVTAFVARNIRGESLVGRDLTVLTAL